jgi:hypothetical protein
MNDNDRNNVLPDENNNIIPDVTYFDHHFRSFFTIDGDSIPFNNIDELCEQIELYEKESKIRLHITKANARNVYRKYKCVTHCQCQFTVTFGKRDDNKIVLKRHQLYHN